MENTQTQFDINIRKLFEIKMKPGMEMKYVHLDESNNLRNLYFLKGTHLYQIDMSNKKLNECELCKGNEIIYITGNYNNAALICVFKTGKIIAIDSSSTVKFFKNINITTFIGKKEINLDKFQVFVNNDLDKVIIATESYIFIWYQNNLIAKVNPNELSGTFFNISKTIELKKLNITGLNNSLGESFSFNERISALFSNDYYIGSHSRLFYVMLIPCPLVRKLKLVVIDYLFCFDYLNKYKLITEGQFNNQLNIFEEYFAEENEDLIDIKTKISFTILPLAPEKKKEKIVLKPNLHGNILAICLNFGNKANSTLIFFICETYRFSSRKLKTLLGPKQPEIVQDMDWICNDMLLFILFTNGTFMLININFQVILVSDSSQSVLPDDLFYTPMHYNINKPKENDYPKLIISKQRDDCFFIYSNLYAICFKVNYSQFENRLNDQLKIFDNFEDILYEFKYLQIYVASSSLFSQTNDMGENVLNIIHQYIMNNISGNEKLNITNDSNRHNATETNNNILSSFVKFICIFRSINQTHETNLTVFSYLMGRANNFFIHLINHHEIWLAALFLEVCEIYLLDPMTITNKKLVSLTPEESNAYVQKEISYQIFNPYQVVNSSYKGYSMINNSLKFIRQRIILIFFCVIEFRNNFALHINSLHFILAKHLMNKLQKNNLLEDMMRVMKTIIKNFNLIVQEERNQRNISDFTLFCDNLRPIEQFQNNRGQRTDINFNFFLEFYSGDEYSNFIETSESYITNDEIELLSEYNCLNNTGIIQIWILLFTNYLYSELFQDLKKYIDNHLRQTTAKQKKSAENISPTEKNLSKLIYFNIDFFLGLIQFYLKNFLSYATKKENYGTEANFIYDSPTIIDNYYKTYLPFLSPIDVPFLIFEYYNHHMNPQHKTLPSEIYENLMDLIESRSKQNNITVDDALDFIDFLILNGFKYDFDDNDDGDNYSKNNAQRIQTYIYSAFLFYLFIIHKLNMIFKLETDSNMIFAIIDSFDPKMKRECYEYIFLTINGQFRYYLKLDVLDKNNTSEGKYLSIILSYIKLLFYKIIQEESYEVHQNISEFVQITPNIMKGYLLDGALFYEYKNFNKLIKSHLFSFTDILSISKMKKTTINKETNYFELIFNTNALNQLFPADMILNIQTILNNLIHLCRIDKEMIFNIETNREYIHKLVLTSMNTDENNEPLFNDVISSTIDKIIKGNFENKTQFQFSNNDLKNQLIRGIKIALIKVLHLLNILFIKLKMYSSYSSKDYLNYIKMISFCLMHESNPFNVIEWTGKIIDYITELNLKELKYDLQKVNMFEILKNIQIIAIKYKIHDNTMKKLDTIITRLEKENKDIHIKYKYFINNTLPQLKEVFVKIRSIKSRNLKNFIFSIFNDNYLENIYQIYNQMTTYLNYSNSSNKIPLKNARKKYIKLCENFYNLTGIPQKGYIEFHVNWQLIENDLLYQSIISDDFSDSTQIPREEKTSIVMNTRQKSGIETPKRKSRVGFDQKNPSRGDSSRKKRPRADSLDIREETTSQIQLKNKAKNKVPKYQYKTDDNTKQATSINKTSIDVLETKLKCLMLLQLKKHYYSKEAANASPNKLLNENREIKLFNIKAKENSIEVILLKEKFNKEANNSNVKGKDKEDLKKIVSLKPFDIININKVKPNAFDNSKAVNFSKVKRVDNSSIESMIAQLNKYESIAQNMGKDYINGNLNGKDKTN